MPLARAVSHWLSTLPASPPPAHPSAGCSLPPVPAGARGPATPGEALRLVFATGGLGFQPVRIQDSGCPHVTESGRPASGHGPRSKRLLSEAVGGKGKLIPGTHPSSVPTP